MSRTQQGSASRGFTLIELMVVVAIVGILASLAVILFGSEKKKMTARSEVTSVFAEIKIRQEQHRLENNTYISSNTSNDESEMHPSAPSSDGSETLFVNTFPAGSGWETLGFSGDVGSVVCSYVTIAGLAGDGANIGAIATSFGFTAPADDWYYVAAECDMDHNATTNSFYFQHSGEAELFYQNQGN